MTVCRYFLKGFCRYGDRCRFEHVNPNLFYQKESPRRNNYINQSSCNISYNRRNSENIRSYNERNEYTQTSKRKYPSEGYGPGINESQANRFCQNKSEWVSDDYKRQQYQRRDTENNTSTPNIRVNFSVGGAELQRTNHPVDLSLNKENLVYVELIKDDIKEWELGSQWPFTCYSLILRSNFPEFFDLSPEELRYEAYQARENNTIDSYVKSVENAQQRVNSLRNQLKNPSVELISFIEHYCTRQSVIVGSEVDGAFSRSNKSPYVGMLSDESSC